MLSNQGWNKIVVLALPSVALPDTKITDSTPRVVLSDFSENSITEALSSIRQTYGAIGGLVHIHPRFEKSLRIESAFEDAESNIVKLVYFLAKHLKKRLNGNLGFGGPITNSIIAGGLNGLVKTVNIEWGSVFCRSIDFEPDATEKQISDSLQAEMNLKSVSR